MSRTLARYVVSLFLAFFSAILIGVTALYLLVDYGDRQRFLSELSTSELFRLYGFRSVMALQQLAPAALLLAAGATLSSLRQRGEWVAIQSLGISRAQLLLPVMLTAGVIAVALIAVDDQLVTRASLAARQLSPTGFQSFAARPQTSTQRWFRVDNTFLQVRGEQTDDAFLDVNVYEMTPDFRLNRSTHVTELRFVGDGVWRGAQCESRSFDNDGSSTFSTSDTMEFRAGQLTRDAFLLSASLPEDLRISQLMEQVRIRETLSLQTQAFAYMINLRLAYPMMGVAAALLAAFLALRQGRVGHLTTVLIEGVGVALLLMVLLTVARTLVMSGRLPPLVAAWLPVAGLFLAIAIEVQLRNRQRRLHEQAAQ